MLAVISHDTPPVAPGIPYLPPSDSLGSSIGLSPGKFHRYPVV